MILDGALIAAAVSLAFTWKFQASGSPEILLHVYFIPFSILVRWALYTHFRLYDFSKRETSLDLVYYLFWAGVLASGVEWLALLIVKSYYLKERAGVSREIILNSWGIILLTTAFWRIYYRVVRRRLGEHIHRVAVVGAGETALKVRQEIRRFAHSELQVVGFIATGEVCPDARLNVIGQIDQMHQTLPDQRIDDLVIATEPSERNRMLEVLNHCEAIRCPIRISLHPDLVELYVGKVALTDLAGLPLIQIPGRSQGFYLIAKRTMDLAVASIGLLLLLLPGCLIALGIKLEGLFRPEARGSVLFSQERVGKDQKRFRLHKFRTMIRTAEDSSGPVLAKKRDPRITRVGTVLRRTGIDELPQLWNILKGEMSLVGPRPERPEFVETFLQEEPAYAIRFRLRPGITGLAQIHGHYDSSAASKLRYDLVYLANHSPLLDIRILFRTLQVIMTGRKYK